MEQRTSQYVRLIFGCYRGSYSLHAHTHPHIQELNKFSLNIYLSTFFREWMIGWELLNDFFYYWMRDSFSIFMKPSRVIMKRFSTTYVCMFWLFIFLGVWGPRSFPEQLQKIKCMSCEYGHAYFTFISV